MQDQKQRRSNAQRSEDMRARLVSAARALFVEKGFADTPTPEIVRQAEVTRGALYHHFADKADLFRAVVEVEADALAREIDAAAQAEIGRAMAAGTRAFFSAMARPGRVRLLLVDGPAVLGPEVMDRIDAGGGRRSLRDGLTAAMPERSQREVTALADLLSAAFDRAAMRVAAGQDPEVFVDLLTEISGG